MQASAQKIVNRPAVTSAPPVRIQRTPGVIQPAASLRISSPSDPAEREAEHTARHIMRMPEPAGVTGVLNARVSPHAARFSGIIQQSSARQSTPPHFSGSITSTSALARTATTPAASLSMSNQVSANPSSGQPLPQGVRQFMEPRFATDFSKVRIHTGEQAARLSSEVSAQAFTVGNQVYFGRDRFQPESSEGRELIAHELTHTIQQGAATQRNEVQRRASVTVNERSTPQVQRLGLSDAFDYIADHANHIPGFRMFTIILGVNPINMSRVERNAANILRAVVELIPGGALITQALDNHGVFERVSNWVEQQIRTLGMTGSMISDAIKRFIKSLSLRDVFNLGGVWERAKRIFTEPITRIINFAKGLITGIMRFIKDAILMPLARLASGTRGWDLLCAVLGRNPITNEAVPRSAETLIGGFMRFIGQDEVWENIKKGNAITRAWTWFQGALAGLTGLVLTIPQKIIATLAALTIMDILTVVGVFRKVVGTFISIAVSFVSWGINQVIGLLEILFSVVAPGVMPYIKKAQAAFISILKNPVAFVGNLVRAGKQGFMLFASNIVTHLKTALINWLVGPLADAGVYIPKSFSLLEIIKLVLSVLGLTWQNIRAKLVKIIPDPILSGLEKTSGILVTLVREGPAAAWQQIKTELNELKSQIISQITQMISLEIVKAAVLKLVSMLNPAGAIIQAIIAIYNTITFFIEKIKQIAAVVAAFVNSIAAIAAGQVAAAAQKVEMTMAATLTVIIAFLAKFAGLGNIPARLVAIVKKIRQPIDRALDKIVGFLGKMLQKLAGTAKAAVRRLLDWWNKKVAVNAGGETHTLTFTGSSKQARLVLRSIPEKPSVFLENTGNSKGVESDKRKLPVATAVRHENTIEGFQSSLAKYEENTAATAGSKTDEADKLMGRMDVEMSILGTHIATTLNNWKITDAVISGITLPRGKFSPTQKRGIAEQHATKKDLVSNSKGETVNLQAGLARRHVVSSYDMAKHYTDRLNSRKISEGKLLLEQRASLAEARTPVDELSVHGIQKAATSRYSHFFGYLRNMFIGDSRENSSIQEHLDRGHPDMAKQQLQEHVSHVKRAWAFDKNMTISGLDEE